MIDDSDVLDMLRRGPATSTAVALALGVSRQVGIWPTRLNKSVPFQSSASGELAAKLSRPSRALRTWFKFDIGMSFKDRAPNPSFSGGTIFEKSVPP